MKKIILLFSLFFLSEAAYSVTFESIGVGGGGAFYSPAINPANPQEIFVASDMSGLYRTKNQGTSWDLYHYSKLRAKPQSKVCFTSDSKIMYTIHNDFGADLNVPVKSTDAGETWQVLENEPTYGNVYYIYSDESVTNRLIIASEEEIFYSKDGGNSFTNIYQGDALTSYGAYISGIHWDGQNIVICLPDAFLQSTNGGTSFSFVPAFGFESMEFAISFASVKSGNTTKFYCITVDALWAGIQGYDTPQYLGFYSMDYSNGNDTWVVKNITLPNGSNPNYLSIAKNAPNTIYMAGYLVETSNSRPMVLKSTNAGTTFSEVFNTTNNKNIATGWSGYNGDRDWSYGEFALGFTCSSTNSNIAVITDLGFVHLTTDGGTSWKQVYADKSNSNPVNAATPKGKNYTSNGLENTTCWWVELSRSPLSPNIFAAYTDIRGILSTDQGKTWGFNYTGHTDNTMYHILPIQDLTSNVTLYGATSTIHDLYQSTYLQDLRIDGGSGKILYSNNYGKDWKLLKDMGAPVIYLATNPNDPKKMYASVVNSSKGGIYYCDDIIKNTSWVKLSNPPRTEGHPYNIIVLKDNSIICTYSGRRDPKGAFTQSSGVFISKDNGASWSDISDISMRYWTKDITIDPFDPNQNTFYVGVFSGWGGGANGLGGLYKTTDRGKTWNKIFDSDKVESAAIHPKFPDRMYVTTEFDGLWVTNNLNSANPEFKQVTDYPFQHPLRVFFNFPQQIPESYQLDMWVTSFGNGIKIQKIETYIDVKDEEDLNGSNSISVYPNPASEKLNIINNLGSSTIQKIEAFNSLGELIYTSGNTNILPNESFVINVNSLNIFINELVIFKLVTGENNYFKKIIINK
jgi:photosystem II stability/assembly factor-like uncharacterized protein